MVHSAVHFETNDNKPVHELQLWRSLVLG